jgi:hypothetical protein
VQSIKDSVPAVEAALEGFSGRTAWIHAEWIPGGFLRNMRVEVVRGYLRGGGPYRVALRCAGDAWVRIEDVTDWECDAEGRLCFLAFGDAEQRLSRTLEISPRPLPA